MARAAMSAPRAAVRSARIHPHAAAWPRPVSSRARGFRYRTGEKSHPTIPDNRSGRLRKPDCDCAPAYDHRDVTAALSCTQTLARKRVQTVQFRTDHRSAALSLIPCPAGHNCRNPTHRKTRAIRAKVFVRYCFSRGWRVRSGQVYARWYSSAARYIDQYQSAYSEAGNVQFIAPEGTCGSFMPCMQMHPPELNAVW